MQERKNNPLYIIHLGKVRDQKIKNPREVFQNIDEAIYDYFFQKNTPFVPDTFVVVELSKDNNTPGSFSIKRQLPVDVSMIQRAIQQNLQPFARNTDEVLAQFQKNKKIEYRNEPEKKHREAFFDRRGANEADAFEEKLWNFLSISKNMYGADKFIKTIVEATKDINNRGQFFDLDNNEKVKFLLKLRKTDFFKAFENNWQIGAEFLDKVMKDNLDSQLKQELLNSRYGSIYRLNQLRREVIPIEMRQQTPIDVQQRYVQERLNDREARIRAYQRAREEKEKEDARKLEKVRHDVQEITEGLRTQAIARLEGDFAKEKKPSIIPQELVCQLSGEMFKHPVKLVHVVGGKEHTFYFEKVAILQALALKKENPFNKEYADESMLQEAPEKQAEVEQFKYDLCQGQHAEKLAELQRQIAEEKNSPGYLRK